MTTTTFLCDFYRFILNYSEKYIYDDTKYILDIEFSKSMKNHLYFYRKKYIVKHESNLKPNELSVNKLDILNNDFLNHIKENIIYGAGFNKNDEIILKKIKLSDDEIIQIFNNFKEYFLINDTCYSSYQLYTICTIFDEQLEVNFEKEKVRISEKLSKIDNTYFFEFGLNKIKNELEEKALSQLYQNYTFPKSILNNESVIYDYKNLFKHLSIYLKNEKNKRKIDDINRSTADLWDIYFSGIKFLKLSHIESVYFHLKLKYENRFPNLTWIENDVTKIDNFNDNKNTKWNKLIQFNEFYYEIKLNEFCQQKFSNGDETKIIKILSRLNIGIESWNILLKSRAEYFIFCYLLEITDFLVSKYDKHELENAEISSEILSKLMYFDETNKRPSAKVDFKEFYKKNPSGKRNPFPYSKVQKIISYINKEFPNIVLKKPNKDTYGNYIY